MAVVYKITSPSDSKYVGSTISPEVRFNKYKAANCKGQIRLYNSIMKYGWEAHTLEIIAIVEPEQRYKWEHILGMYYNVLDNEKGLNCHLPGYDEVPKVVSESTRKKLSEGRKGTKQSKETLAILSKIRTGKSPSSETREKQRLKLKGRKRPIEVVEKVAKKNRMKLIDVVTGEKYNSIKDAISKTGIGHLSQMLSGDCKNTTTIIYDPDDPKTKVANLRAIKRKEERENNIRTVFFSKKVLDINTGEVYSSVKEAADAFNIDKTCLSKKLNGHRENKTGLIFVNDCNNSVASLPVIS